MKRKREKKEDKRRRLKTPKPKPYVMPSLKKLLEGDDSALDELRGNQGKVAS